jgi:hypothetical protein
MRSGRFQNFTKSIHRPTICCRIPHRYCHTSLRCVCGAIDGCSPPRMEQAIVGPRRGIRKRACKLLHSINIVDFPSRSIPAGTNGEGKECANKSKTFGHVVAARTPVPSIPGHGVVRRDHESEPLTRLATRFPGAGDGTQLAHRSRDLLGTFLRCGRLTCSRKALVDCGVDHGE